MESESTFLKHKIQKDYFEELAQNLPDIIGVIDPVNFKVLYTNRVQQGFKPEEVIGDEVFKFIYPEHIGFFRETLDQIVLTGKTETIELETARRSDKSGKAWYRFTISPLKKSTGEIENILIISKDITSEKLRDIELHNKQEKIYAIINNTKDMICSIDRDFMFTEYNSVLGNLVGKGYGKVNLIGMSVLDFIDPNKHDHLKAIYARVFKGEVVYDIESFGTNSGRYVYNESSYHPIYNFEKEVTGISIFSRDITERVLSEQKLKNTLKEREVLLSEIHHRIKNNLALVSSMLQLKEMNLDNEAAVEALSDSRKRIKSTALVHEMLYRNDSFDNLKLKEYVTELFNNVNVNTGFTLQLEGDDYILDHSKALSVGLMLHELMMNSFKHSFKGKDKAKLTVKTKLENGNLNICYCDCSGKFHDEVDFNDTSSTGLMLIHTFIEQLNGSIELTKREPPSYNINIPIS